MSDSDDHGGTPREVIVVGRWTFGEVIVVGRWTCWVVPVAPPATVLERRSAAARWPAVPTSGSCCGLDGDTGTVWRSAVVTVEAARLCAVTGRLSERADRFG
jgi:hypothetical protein